MAEDPPAAAEALAIPCFPAEATRPARGDARDEHAVADLDRLHAAADCLDRAHCFVAEDPAVGHRGHVAFEDVQISAADGDGVDADDRVGVAHERGLRDIFPGLLAGTVIHERLHERTSWSSRTHHGRVEQDPVEANGTSIRERAVRPCSVVLISGSMNEWQVDMRNAELLDGREIHIRPISPADSDALVRFHQGLSDETTRLRFFVLPPGAGM